MAMIAGGGLYNAKGEAYYHSTAWAVIRDQAFLPAKDDSTVDGSTAGLLVGDSEPGDISAGLLQDNKRSDPATSDSISSRKDDTGNVITDADLSIHVAHIIRAQLPLYINHTHRRSLLSWLGHTARPNSLLMRGGICGLVW